MSLFYMDKKKQRIYSWGRLHIPNPRVKLVIEITVKQGGDNAS